MKARIIRMARLFAILRGKPTRSRTSRLLRPTVEPLEGRTLPTVVCPGPSTPQGVDVSHANGTID
jgi:hypothetical protein